MCFAGRSDSTAGRPVRFFMSSQKNNIIWNMLKILLAVMLAGFVLSRTDLGQLSGLPGRISVPWLLVTAVLYLSLTLLKAAQYHLLLQGRMGYPQVLNVTVLQNAVGNYFATGAGVLSYFTLLRAEYDVRVSRAFLLFLLTKLGDLIALGVGLLVSAALLGDQLQPLRSLTVGLLAGIGIVLLAFACTVTLRRMFVDLLAGALGRMKLTRFRPVQKGLELLQAFADAEPGMWLSRLGWVMLLSLVYFAVSVGWYYSMFQVFTFPVRPAGAAYVSTMLQLLSYFPIQIFGGLGVSDVSALYLWGVLGVEQAVMAPVLVGSRVLFYLLNLLPLIYLPVYALFLQKTERTSPH